jgi:glycine/D-amino acid oxidase-like deaminating enzyme
MSNTMDWPYPVDYGKENEIETDVLILGGGVAGCHAAISAAKRGARVAVVEKGAVIRSGSGGAGVDHWHGALTNPCSKLTADEMMELARGSGAGYLSDVKSLFVAVYGLKEEIPLGKAMRELGFALEGTHHSDSDDARTIARILGHILPSAWYKEQP